MAQLSKKPLAWMSGRRLAGPAAGVFLFSLVARTIGYALSVLLAATFGAGRVLDAHFLALTLGLALSSIVAWAVEMAILPVIIDLRENRGEHEVNKLLSTVIFATLLLLGAVSLALAVAAPKVIALAGPGFDAQSRALAAGLLRVLAIGIPVTGLASIATAVLNADRRFLIPKAAACVQGLMPVAVVIVFGRQWGIWSVAAGCVAGSFAALAIQSVALGRTLVGRLPMRIDLRHEPFRRAMVTLVPFLGAVAVGQVFQLVDRAVASTLGVGTIVCLSLGYSIVQAFMLLPIAVSTVLYTELAEHSARGSAEKYVEAFGRGFAFLAHLLVPAMVGLWLVGRPVVAILYSRGAFSEDASARTAVGLWAYAPMVVAMGLGIFAARALYALQKARVTQIVSIVSIGANIVLDLVLARIWGYVGLAVASSISATLYLGLLLLALTREVRPRSLRPVLLEGVRISVAAAIGVAGAVTLREISPGAPQAAWLQLAAFLAMYGAATLIMRLEIRERLGGRIGRLVWRAGLYD